jgi:pimeloyl-ACP methyl ester carboxylesterase
VTRLQAAQALIHDAVDAVTLLVAEGHASTARNLSRATSGTPLDAPVGAVLQVHGLTTTGVLRAVRLTNGLVEQLTGLAWRLAPEDRPPPLPLRSDVAGKPAWAVDMLTGAVNGFAGDHLFRTGNTLDMGMSLRVEGPPAPRIVVLVHGLSATEWSWSLDAERRLGAPDHNYGSLLQRDLGYTPVFARYNSGLPIEANGARLAVEIDRFVRSSPVDVGEIVLLGHSMGGLVARAALAATEAELWRARARHLVTLATPHEGAPLARFADAVALGLGAVDLPASRIVSAILRARSAGIQDLAPAPTTAGAPIPSTVKATFLSATLLPDPEHPLARVAGDGLVCPTSAAGPEHPGVKRKNFPGRNHLEIQVDREVYGEIREVLSG